MELREGTDQRVNFGEFIDVTDGVTFLTGLATSLDNGTTGIKISKNGGNHAVRSASNSSVYASYGMYQVWVDANDSDSPGRLEMFWGDENSTYQVKASFDVLPAALYDAKYGTGIFDVNVAQINGQANAAVALQEGVEATVAGTVGNGSTNDTIVASSLYPAVVDADQFKGKILTFLGNTTTAALRSQSTTIQSMTANGVITVIALTANAVNGDKFRIG